MPLSKERNRERMRQARVQPKTNPNVTPCVQPNYQPACDPTLTIAEQVRLLYPDGKLPTRPDGRNSQ